MTNGVYMFIILRAEYQISPLEGDDFCVLFF